MSLMRLKSNLLANTSIVIPAKNEENGLKELIPKICSLYPDLLEIIVVDDGSTDATALIAKKNGATLISHEISRGNGAAIKSGVRAAKGDYVCFMDADGQHKPDSIARLLTKLSDGFDMVVGARKKSSQAGYLRFIANSFYNWFSSKITSYPIKDLTSGLKVAKTKKFREFLHLLPNGFSYPTTSTMAFLRTGYQVGYIYEEIESERLGKSHINPIKDGIRFLIIIFKIGTLYSPLKVFTPISFGLFFTGISYYVYTFFELGRLTNLSVILFTSSLLVFLIGLVSEQINTLMYVLNAKK